MLRLACCGGQGIPSSPKWSNCHFGPAVQRYVATLIRICHWHLLSSVHPLFSMPPNNRSPPALELHPRGACQETAGQCPCGGWVGERGMDPTAYHSPGPRQVRVLAQYSVLHSYPHISSSQTPRTATEKCAACNHSWHSHHSTYVPLPSSRAYGFMRGVCFDSACGGFYSVSTIMFFCGRLY